PSVQSESDYPLKLAVKADIPFRQRSAITGREQMQQTTWLFNHGVDVRAPHELRDRLARVKKAPAILPRGRGLNNNTGRHTRNNAAVPWLLFVSRATLLTKLSPQITRWNFLVPLDFSCAAGSFRWGVSE